MNSTFQNSATVLSIGIFFTLMIVGLAGTLPASLTHGLAAYHVPANRIQAIAHQPPVSVLFSAFLGYNPIEHLVGAHVLAQISRLHPASAAALTGQSFFPQLISEPFRHGLAEALDFAVVACLVAAAASWLRGGRYVYTEQESPAMVAAVPLRAGANGDGPRVPAAAVERHPGTGADSPTATSGGGQHEAEHVSARAGEELSASVPEDQADGDGRRPRGRTRRRAAELDHVTRSSSRTPMKPRRS
jgi:hypothetical protein